MLHAEILIPSRLKSSPATIRCIVTITSCEVLIDKQGVNTDHFPIITELDPEVTVVRKAEVRNFRDVSWKEFRKTLCHETVIGLLLFFFFPFPCALGYRTLCSTSLCRTLSFPRSSPLSDSLPFLLSSHHLLAEVTLRNINCRWF